MASNLKRWARRYAGDGGGEGSRGGKVIGHTKTGKPIYAPREGHADAGAADLPLRGQAFAAKHSAGYAKGDHFAAAKTMMAAAKAARAQGKTALAFHLGAVAAGHKQIARGQDAYGQDHETAGGWKIVRGGLKSRN